MIRKCMSASWSGVHNVLAMYVVNNYQSVRIIFVCRFLGQVWKEVVTVCKTFAAVLRVNTSDWWTHLKWPRATQCGGKRGTTDRNIAPAAGTQREECWRQTAVSCSGMKEQHNVYDLQIKYPAFYTLNVPALFYSSAYPFNPPPPCQHLLQ